MHSFNDKKKIVSEFFNNKKKTHSTEIDLEVAASIVKGPPKEAPDKTQRAVDDGNFWKNPVNQVSQIDFQNSNPSKEAVKYGGHISRDELAKHHKHGDAWIALNGRVYDVTKYAAIHPGGKKIALGYGKDATELYNKYHSWVNVDAIIGKCFIGMLE